MHCDLLKYAGPLALLLALAVSTSTAAASEPPAGDVLQVPLTITTRLSYRNTPLDPTIDFPALLRGAGARGVLDPNSIEVIDLASHQPVPHALSEDFAYSDTGRIEFVIANPQHRRYELRFRTVEQRSPLEPQAMTPQIGVGDLLRYNAGVPRPIAVAYSAGLDDLDADGQLDLTGCWNYAYRPGWPWDGIVCFRRTHPGRFEFADLTRLRYINSGDDPPRWFSHIYMAVDFADFNRDGLLDLVMTRRGTDAAQFYLNTGQREPSGMPIFSSASSVAVSPWNACRAVDLDQDGATDLVVDGQYVRNSHPQGWPFRAADPVQLDAGRQPCFLDLDQDGRLDAVCLQGGRTVQPDFYQVAWRRNLGGTPPRFGDEQLIGEVDLDQLSQVAAWSYQSRSGLIVQHAAFRELACYELGEPAAGLGRRRLRMLGSPRSVSAVMSLSDQAWPWFCDWDDDGDLDLLAGGGYGWPQLAINDGSRTRPEFRAPQPILSQGQPIRFVRNRILGRPHNGHDMGYPFPVFVDWDGDGLKDLVCPNETNRIFWYPNIGRRGQPQFGPRRQVRCDGYPDSRELRSQSNRRANDPGSNNGVYPLEAERPFMWRTGAALADFNGDGLMDLVTHDGHTRVATLFAQYRASDSKLRLRKDRVLRLADGRAINDAIVSRQAHWTESFRACDWNGDGLQDLVYSVAGSHHGTQDGGSIYLLRNVGTRSDPRFANPETMRCFGEPIRITNHGPHPWLGDFDGDGKPDLVACVEWSVYPYYSHAALMMKARPQWELGRVVVVRE